MAEVVRIDRGTPGAGDSRSPAPSARILRSPRQRAKKLKPVDPPPARHDPPAGLRPPAAVSQFGVNPVRLAQGVREGLVDAVRLAHQAYSSRDMPARTIVQIATDIEQVNARIVRLEADIQTQRVKLASLVQELTQSEALARLGTRLEVENVQDDGPAVGSRPARAPRAPATGADRERRSLGRSRTAEKVPPEPDQGAVPVPVVEAKAAEQPAPTS